MKIRAGVLVEPGGERWDGLKSSQSLGPRTCSSQRVRHLAKGIWRQGLTMFAQTQFLSPHVATVLRRVKISEKWYIMPFEVPVEGCVTGK